jgi:hypothetical protein
MQRCSERICKIHACSGREISQLFCSYIDISLSDYLTIHICLLGLYRLADLFIAIKDLEGHTVSIFNPDP